MAIALLQAGTGNFVALVLGAISMKILAVIAGPSGVGMFSLLKSLQQALSALGSFSGQTAIVQATPGKLQHLQERFVVSVFWTVTGGTMLVAIVSAVFANQLAAYFLSVEMAYLILWLSVPTVLGATFLYFRAILTACLEIRAVAWVNISVGLAALLVSGPVALGYVYFDAGVLIALLAFPLAVGAVLAYVKTCKSGYLAGQSLFKSALFEWLAVKQFLRLAFPSLLVGLIGLASILIVRLIVSRQYGFDGAGSFDAGWTINAMYLMVFLSAMQSYLLPSMRAESEGDINVFLFQALRLVIIVSVPLITFVIVCSPLLISILYSSEFHLALDLLRWNLLGDYFRVSSWVLATYLLARIDMTAYLIHEALWNLVFVIVAIWLLRSGLAGVGKAYIVAYAIYLGALLWRICVHHGVRVSRLLLAEWAVGAGVILFAGLITWNAEDLNWSGAAAMSLAIAFGFLVSRANERTFVMQFLFGWMRPLP